MNCMNPHCKGSGIPGMHNHHIILKSQGGSDEEWNRIPLCVACHEYPHGRNNPKLYGKKVTGRQYMIEILRNYRTSIFNSGRWQKVLEILMKKEGIVV